MNEKRYNNWAAMSDKAIAESIGQYVQHHRLKKNISQTAVADAAGISRSTLSLLERGGKVTLATLIQVLRVLDLLYVMDTFKVEQEVSPIAYAKLLKNQRKHAYNIAAEPDPNEDLGW